MDIQLPESFQQRGMGTLRLPHRVSVPDGSLSDVLAMLDHHGIIVEPSAVDVLRLMSPSEVGRGYNMDAKFYPSETPPAQARTELGPQFDGVISPFLELLHELPLKFEYACIIPPGSTPQGEAYGMQVLRFDSREHGRTLWVPPI
jgi:hypothetical protein